MLRLPLLTLLLTSLLFTRAHAAPELGLQTWTCRNMNFDQVVAFAQKHGIKKIQFIGTQLNPTAPREESLRKKAVLSAAGLTAYTIGVAKTTLNKEENRALFEFAKLMDIRVIVVEPKDPLEWDNLEELVKEYDIKLAIHNHGTGTVYGDPATVRAILAKRDPRIGVCMDVGWITAAGFDAAETFLSYGDRVFDMHFKDKKVTVTDGKRVPIDTEIGQGDANYAGLFAAIKKTNWKGVLAIETDSKAFAEDPNRLVAGAKTFFEQHFPPAAKP
jgi:L-ribulose-5-phosphate 3-epimerase